MYPVMFFVLKCKNSTLEEQAIVNLLQMNPEITQKEIAKQIIDL